MPPGRFLTGLYGWREPQGSVRNNEPVEDANWFDGHRWFKKAEPTPRHHLDDETWLRSAAETAFCWKTDAVPRPRTKTDLGTQWTQMTVNRRQPRPLLTSTTDLLVGLFNPHFKSDTLNLQKLLSDLYRKPYPS